MQLRKAFYRELPQEQKIFDYADRTDGQPVYRGFSKIGTATSAPGWIMVYSKFDVSGFVTEEYTLEGIWDDRAVLFLPYV